MRWDEAGLSRFKGIQVDGNGAPDQVIKRFIRKTRECGVLQEQRDRATYLKPSQERRRKRSRAAYRDALQRTR